MPNSSDTASFTELWFDGPLSTKFFARLYTPSGAPARAVLIYVHGYIDHVSHYTDTHLAWARRGIALFAFDQRGFGKTALGDRRSAHSKFGRTGGGWERMVDVEWAVKEARARVGEVPVFLMGFSMGGGIVLDFASRPESPPNKETVSLLSGVIVTSPLILLVRPPPRALETLLIWISKVFPNMLWYTPVEAEALSHDQELVGTVKKDKLLKPYGSLEGIGDMLTRGSRLLAERLRTWPADLPVLFLHGEGDTITSSRATRELFDKMRAADKQIILYPHMMHDLNGEPDVRDKFLEDCISWVEKHVAS
ncbi:lysophospholipase [Vararia minispora EC-137]|uniref:Lysophospholipase n=1 Tax=Vararia minispora EC-137 TaxID=1314806 RepID=A0ACB8QKN4_9AGAM|nr:lysophospholipase [Vararia minispora EC-137]